MGQLLEFAGNHPIMVAGVIAAWLAVLIYEIHLKTQGASNVSVTDAVRLINRGAVIIDVRKPDAFVTGHIVNSKNIDLDELEEKQKTLAKYKKKVLLTVCDNGTSSGKAAALLRKLGFEQSFSIRGGLKGWRSDNMPVEK